MFEMGAKFNDGWSLDEGDKEEKKTACRAYDKHQLIIAKEKRKGKVVTIVKPFYLDKKTLQVVLKKLKKKLATGGTHKENTLEFQGDIKDILVVELSSLGFGMKC